MCNDLGRIAAPFFRVDNALIYPGDVKWMVRDVEFKVLFTPNGDTPSFSCVEEIRISKEGVSCLITQGGDGYDLVGIYCDKDDDLGEENWVNLGRAYGADFRTVREAIKYISHKFL